MQKEMNIVKTELRLVSVNNSKADETRKADKTSYDKAYEKMQRQLRASDYRMLEQPKRELKLVVKEENLCGVSREQLEAETADLSSLGLSVSLFEVDYNNEATSYVESHITKLTNIARGLNIDPSKADDLVMDVYESLMKAESNGEGYMMNSDKASMIGVSEFVIGRIKGYSKNRKYAKIVVNNAGGGNTILTRSASSCDGDSEENKDPFMMQFKNASYDYDDYENIDEFESLREQLQFIDDMDKQHEFGIMSLIKNMDKLSDILGGVKMNKFDSVFCKIRQAVSEHDELGEALLNVIEFSKNNRAQFEVVLASI